MASRLIGPPNDPYSAKPDTCPITAFSTGFRIFGNVDGLADRTLDSLKACGFDTISARRSPLRGGRGDTPLANPSVCKGLRHGEGLRSSARRVS
jgi:hypothetical protein